MPNFGSNKWIQFVNEQKDVAYFHYIYTSNCPIKNEYLRVTLIIRFLSHKHSKLFNCRRIFFIYDACKFKCQTSFDILDMKSLICVCER